MAKEVIFRWVGILLLYETLTTFSYEINVEKLDKLGAVDTQTKLEWMLTHTKEKNCWFESWTTGKK